MYIENFQAFFSSVLQIGQAHLIPVMLGLFIIGFLFKMGAWFSASALNRFVNQVDLNVDDIISEKKDFKAENFYELTQKVLECSFEECYEKQQSLGRRKLDRISTLRDRVFLFKEGSHKIVKDTLKQTKHYNRFEQRPDFYDVSQYVFQSNPIYNRIIGFFQLDKMDEFISILPNIFVVLGILGTFLGITLSLPELSGLNPSQVEQTQKAMDLFLEKVVFSMNTSILGIVLAIFTNILISITSVGLLFQRAKDSYSNCLGLLWSEAHRTKGQESQEEEEEQVA